MSGSLQVEIISPTPRTPSRKPKGTELVRLLQSLNSELDLNIFIPGQHWSPDKHTGTEPEWCYLKIQFLFFQKYNRLIALLEKFSQRVLHWRSRPEKLTLLREFLEFETSTSYERPTKAQPTPDSLPNRSMPSFFRDRLLASAQNVKSQQGRREDQGYTSTDLSDLASAPSYRSSRKCLPLCSHSTCFASCTVSVSPLLGQ